MVQELSLLHPRTGDADEDEVRLQQRKIATGSFDDDAVLVGTGRTVPEQMRPFRVGEGDRIPCVSDAAEAHCVPEFGMPHTGRESTLEMDGPNELFDGAQEGRPDEFPTPRVEVTRNKRELPVQLPVRDEELRVGPSEHLVVGERVSTLSSYLSQEHLWVDGRHRQSALKAEPVSSAFQRLTQRPNAFRDWLMLIAMMAMKVSPVRTPVVSKKLEERVIV